VSQPNVSRHHADWLSLVEVSGPFVSLPVLLKTFPQGLDVRDPVQAKVLRAAYEEWQDNPNGPGKQRAWILHVLTQLLEYPQDLIVEGQTLPAGLDASLPEMGETLRPEFALVNPAGSDKPGQAQMLMMIYSSEQALDKPVMGKLWKATPATRMMELLHSADVPLGLVSNGEQWMLIYAPRGEITGYTSWYATLWLDEPITLRAFHSLLSVRRFFGVAADSTLYAMLKESAQDQQEVTDQLGYQVREAVEVLVQSFDALDKESNRALLQGVSAKSQYEASLTIMMRLVFLFSAEERDLLHLGKPLYDENYAVSTLQEQLQEVADRYGEEVLERRYDAWTRLLATFRAVHGGVDHQDLMMQAYDGSLFDPDRYPFLEGRSIGSNWRNSTAEPLAVNNRVVLHLLNSLQRLRTKNGLAGMAETRRVSFRALGVEQIGHVYEGLLDHTAVRANEVVLGISGTRKKEPEIPLSELETLLADSQDKLINFLKDETGRSVSALRKALEQGSLLDDHKLLLACGQDQTLLERLRPFVGIIRDDSFERPLVVLPGSVYVTAGTTRRSTGTHYTPPTLTEPVVQHTLEPLVYQGPAEGWPREQWQLKSPKQILELKVCDMAMGSGAFLVQACRYLAERLVEAWENEEKRHPGEVLTSPEGKFSKAAPSERLIPQDSAERIAIARRTVADRCLYGVDINPMAVEMAKLSMWLITVDKHRPFTFLDHAFKCGDSLLGITNFKQLENFTLRGEESHLLVAFAALNLWRHIDEAKSKRKALEAMPSDRPEQIQAKALLYVEAEESVAKLNAAADILIAVELQGLKGKAYDAEREASADHMFAYWSQGLSELQAFAARKLNNRKCFHWALAFPEIIENGGFHAFVGNPPFAGGKKITGTLGIDFRDFIVSVIARDRKGSADLCAYFFLRLANILRENGLAGLLATNTIAQGDTREVGLDQLVDMAFSIPRAVPSAPWPGLAALEVAHVYLYKGAWKGKYYLNDFPVKGITPFLTPPGRFLGNPYRLKLNESNSFQGSVVLGMGFILEPEQAAEMIAKNPKNRDCLFPYLNGEDLNSRPDQSPRRWVINFHDWPLDRASSGSWFETNDTQRKKWLNSGTVPSDYPDSVAADYPELLKIVEDKVKPERAKVNRDIYRNNWWQFAEKQRSLYSAIISKDRVIAAARVSKMLIFSWVSKYQVFSEALVILALDSDWHFALFESTIHQQWAWMHCSTMRDAGIRYSPTDGAETFPFPRSYEKLNSIGRLYSQFRQSILESRQEGLTKTYNRFHDPKEIAADIAELRNLHVEMDKAVAAAYGWQDLTLDHGFHDTKQGIRYTISELARREVLDRLLELNHQRYADEVAAGLHDKKSKTIKSAGKKSKNIKATADISPQSDIFSMNENA
jgi:hypothetical protein